jgi:hypothetical protein
MTSNKKPRLVVNVKGFGSPSPKSREYSGFGRTAETKVALSETGWIGATGGTSPLQDAKRRRTMNKKDDWDDLEDFIANEWVPLSVAVDMIAADTSTGYISAKANIIEMIADCKLQLRSQMFRDEADIGELKWGPLDKIKTHPYQLDGGFRSNARSQDEPMLLSKRFWNRNEGWLIDPLRVDWESGTIVGLKPTRQKDLTNQGQSHFLTRRAASGVIVRVSSIRPLLSINDAEAAVETRPSPEQVAGVAKTRTTKRGRKKSDPWNVWFAEVTVYLEINGIEDNMTKPDFHDAIKKRLEDRDRSQVLLPFSTVEKAIGEIMNRWREAKANREITTGS